MHSDKQKVLFLVISPLAFTWLLCVSQRDKVAVFDVLGAIWAKALLSLSFCVCMWVWERQRETGAMLGLNPNLSVCYIHSSGMKCVESQIPVPWWFVSVPKGKKKMHLCIIVFHMKVKLESDFQYTDILLLSRRIHLVPCPCWELTSAWAFRRNARHLNEKCMEGACICLPLGTDSIN